MQLSIALRRSWVALPAIVVGFLVFRFWPSSPTRDGVTFVVDTVDNGADTVACTGAAGDCGLLGAVESANGNPGADTIVFDIPVGDCPGGVCTIELDSPVEILDSVTIDATTQPRGSDPQNNVCVTDRSPSRMRVELHNSGFIVDHPGAGSTIRGFALADTQVGANPAGIAVRGGADHHIVCNHIGLDALGTSNAAVPYEYGLRLENVSGATIGTDGDGEHDLGEGNLFGSATEAALVIVDGQGNRVSGNVFGPASPDLTNPDDAVLIIKDSTDNLVGSNQDGVSDESERNYFLGKAAMNMTVATGRIAGNHVIGNTFAITPEGDLVEAEAGIFIPELRAEDTGIEIRDNTFGPVGTGALLAGDVPVLLTGNTFGGFRDGAPYGNVLSLWLVGSGPYTVTGNVFRNAADTAVVLEDTAAIAAASTGNCFAGNAAAVENSTGSTVSLEDDWWNAADGPSGDGPGSGDAVGVDIDFTPWLDSPPEQCNAAPVVADVAFTIAENAAVDTPLGTVPAGDDGASPLRWSITGGDPRGSFAIDKATGELTVAGALDYETTPSFTLTVTAADPFTVGTGMVTVTVTDVNEEPAPVFDDVFSGDAFFADIEWLADQGITRGCNPPENSLFCPNASVTRGQMAALLHRALAGTLRSGGPPEFTDTGRSIFSADIDWLGAAGVTRGCNPPENDLFCPDDVVTRAQMAAFLVRAFGYEAGAGSNRFGDDDGSVFEADIERLAEVGITRGCNPPENDLFCPDAPVTRGQMAAFLHRALG
jgi:hypothetical protein